MRKNQTPEERKLWFQLRNNNLGVKFKRQHSIGGYIADFYCQKYKLIVEVDGEIHNTPEMIENDKVRDKYLTDLGFTILRVLNKEVNENMEEVLGRIKENLCIFFFPSPAFRGGAEQSEEGVRLNTPAY